MSEISKVSVSPATPIFATLSASPDAKVKFTGSVRSSSLVSPEIAFIV